MAEPKEGAKIADFKVHFGDAAGSEPGSLPLRVCIAAHFGAGDAWSTRSTPAERVMALNGDNYDFVFEKFGPVFVLELADPVESGAPPIKANLRWSKLSDLRPNEIVAQVPELRALLEAHRALEQSDAKASPQALATQLERVLPRAHWVTAITRLASAAAPKKAAGETGATGAQANAAKPRDAATKASSGSSADALASLFDLVDAAGAKAREEAQTPDEAPPKAPERTAAAELISRVAGGTSGRGAGAGGLEGARAWVRSTFAHLLTSILEHPEVLRLEGVWRGLRLVLQAAERSKQVELFAAFRTRDESELDALLAQDFDLVCLDDELGDSTHAFEELDRIGELGETYQTPVALNVSPQALGQPNFVALNRLQQTLMHIDHAALLQLKLKASKASARWLSLSGNGLSVRSPHDARSSRLGEVQFAQAESQRSYVDMPASFGLTALVVRSMAKNGHPFQFVGTDHGAIADLEVRHLEQPDFTIATREWVNLDAQIDAASIGVALWSPTRNRAIASLASAPLLYRGEEAARGANPKAKHPLSEAIFLSRLTRALREAKRRFHDLPDEEYARRTRAALLDLFPNAAPPGPTVDVVVKDGRLRVSLDPRRYGSLGVSELSLEVAR